MEVVKGTLTSPELLEINFLRVESFGVLELAWSWKVREHPSWSNTTRGKGGESSLWKPCGCPAGAFWAGWGTGQSQASSICTSTAGRVPSCVGKTRATSAKQSWESNKTHRGEPARGPRGRSRLTPCSFSVAILCPIQVTLSTSALPLSEWWPRCSSLLAARCAP